MPLQCIVCQKRIKSMKFPPPYHLHWNDAVGVDFRFTCLSSFPIFELRCNAFNLHSAAPKLTWRLHLFTTKVPNCAKDWKGHVKVKVWIEIYHFLSHTLFLSYSCCSFHFFFLFPLWIEKGLSVWRRNCSPHFLSLRRLWLFSIGRSIIHPQPFWLTECLEFRISLLYRVIFSLGLPLKVLSTEKLI